jgi:hypothetical protein
MGHLPLAFFHTTPEARRDSSDGAPLTIAGERSKPLRSGNRNRPNSKSALVAPREQGEYLIEGAVKCGRGHDDMNMKLVVRN